MNSPHIRIALSRHKEMLQDHNKAIKFWCTRCSSSVCECAQFFGLFIVVHWCERLGSHPVHLAFFKVIVIDKVCTRSSENITLTIALDLLSSSSLLKSSSSLLSTTASMSR